MKPGNLGKNLAKIMDDLDMTQAELAKRTGLTPAAVSQILTHGNPRLKTICKILTVIPVSFERLMK